jgi:NAD(P)-dependent dehydrogenase (short-subunit alcohol dehydrogenase family)
MNKIAVITGAGRGIGAATARLAAQSGYGLCLAYLSDAAAAEQVADDCRQAGAAAIAVKADVAAPADVEALFAECDRALGPVSLLVNNAATVVRASTVAALTDEVLRRTFEVNVYGAFYCARAAIQRMSRKAGGAGGAIVNVSSTAATLGSPGEYVHYAASKGAIDTFTIGLAKEVGPDGIRVNAVQPGTTDTGIHARVGVPERPAMVARTAPLGRVGRPEDIAEAILWLASDKAAYTTGAILRVGGGL